MGKAWLASGEMGSTFFEGRKRFRWNNPWNDDDDDDDDDVVVVDDLLSKSTNL